MIALTHRRSRRSTLLLGASLLLLGSAVCSSAAPAQMKAAQANAAGNTGDWKQPLDSEKKIYHVLNRLAFGPRPGDVERVRQLGIERWIEIQLAPEKIDDSVVQKKLAVLKALRLPASDLVLAQAADSGLFKKVREEQERERNIAMGKPAEGEALKRREQELYDRFQKSGLGPQTSVQAVGELQLDKITRAVESERQLYEVMVDFWSNHFNLDVKKGPVRALKVIDEREVIRPYALGNFRELLGASAKSPAMLMYLDNASSTREVEMGGPRYQRRGRRNQNQTVAATPGAATPVTAPKKRGGINENYARELMELHTLGVEGGYSQQDVQEVARCFTGWSVDREAGKFLFRFNAHDNGEKMVLGQRIPAGGGIKDGERVLDILVAHPSTAKFLARKLCTRLIADEPPQTIIDKAAKTFSETHGDLRATVKTIVTSPEFFSTAAYRSKIKSPFEFSVSAVRALGGVVLMPDMQTPGERLRLVADGASSLRPGTGGRYNRNPQKTLAVHIADMGQPLYSYQAPTGYSEDSRKWVSTGALVSRLNYALALVGNDIYNVVSTPTSLLKGVDEHDRDAITNCLVERLVGGDISAGTRNTLHRETAGEGAADRMKMTALILGSPEFQRR